MLGWNGIECTRRDVYESLISAVEYRLSQLAEGNLEMDPIKVFVKQEPHKASKLEEGRLRLISAVSLVDQLVDRVLFGPLQRASLAAVGKTPCMIGWSPISSGGYRSLTARFPRGQKLCADKSSWDWTVVGWMCEIFEEFVVSLAIRPTSGWKTAVHSRFQCLFEEAVFQFADGEQIKQRGPGLMKSGWFLTILANSTWQTMLHYLVMLRMGKSPFECEPVSMGDDTLQEVPPQLDEYLEKLSEYCVLKPEVRDDIEFCGFLLEPDRCVPAYRQKHLFLLNHLSEDSAVETLVSYQMLYAFEPVMLAEIQALLESRDKGSLRSERYLRRFAAGVV